jgi:hypothetical protein
VRRTVGIVLAAGGAAFIALVLGEYELVGFVPLAAGVVVGLLVGEAVSGVGRWRGPVAAGVAAALAAASLLGAGWIDSSEGLETFPTLAAVGAALAAAVSVARVAPRRPRQPVA